MAVAVGVVFLLGAFCLAFAVWGVRHPPTEASVAIYRAAPPELGFIVGPIFIGFGLYELGHRLRRGQQPEGRHSRLPSTD